MCVSIQSHAVRETSRASLDFIMSGFGSLISERRQRLGLSSARVGELVGRSPATVRGWERGRSHPDDPVVVSSLAAVLGIEEAALFSAAGMEPPRASTPFSLEETLSTIAPTQDGRPEVRTAEPDSPAPGENTGIEAPSQKLSDVDSPLDKVRTAVETLVDSWRQQQQRVEPKSRVVERVPAVGTERRSMASLSYMEDVEQRWSYRVRSILTAAGVGLLGIVLLWAGSQLLGAVGDVWDALTAGL